MTAQDSDGGNESGEIAEGADQYAEARTSPGVVAPGAYGAAWSSLNKLPSTGGSWRNVTDLPYNSDDPRYRDFDSNSSGGSGNVTGRLAGDGRRRRRVRLRGRRAAAYGAPGPVADTGSPSATGCPAQSTGALALDGSGRLWLGTGEANTNADAYLGSGVYVLTDAHHGTFSARSRVGDELESTTIHQLRFGGGKVWAATSEGVWSHSTETLGGAWKREFAPNPDYLPVVHWRRTLPPRTRTSPTTSRSTRRTPPRWFSRSGGAAVTTTTASTPRCGAPGRGSPSGLGDLPSDADNVGNVTFARSADGSRYYAIDQSPEQLNADPDGGLEGIYVAKSGSPFGPWTKIADYEQLAADGSALTSSGYMPGVQAWYNQFLTVDPANAQHVYAGLEEVYETRDGGAPGPPSARTGTSVSPAGASTPPSRPATATRRPTPTSTGSPWAAPQQRLRRQRRRSLPPGRSTAPRTPPATPPTGRP